MTEPGNIINTGLRGVPVASTRICLVDGKAGKLVYRGYNITELAENATFEEVAYLLLFEHLPPEKELADFKAQIAQKTPLPDRLVAALKTRPENALPMDVLQACVPMLANHDPEAGILSREKATDTAIGLIARFPAIMAAWHRIRNGLEPLAPKPELGHAA
ncbi:MAG: citrate/2-methylcitrate synthase, partial [Desulfosalsimonas sp.]